MANIFIPDKFSEMSEYQIKQIEIKMLQLGAYASEKNLENHKKYCPRAHEKLCEAIATILQAGLKI
jgi:hypothetical protein